MNNILDDKIKEIDFKIENGDSLSAIKSLEDLSEEYPKEGIIQYYLGILAMQAQDENLALEFFLESEKKGCNIAELYLNLGKLMEGKGNILETEKYLLKACEIEKDKERLWVCLSVLSLFYIECEMYIKAGSIARRMIADYPNNYQGYHINFIVKYVKGNLKEAYEYLEKIPDSYKTHPQYLIDYIEILKKQGRKGEIIELFDNDRRFKGIIPQIVLREKIMALNDTELITEKEALIRNLAIEYNDSEAIISSMIIEFERKNFRKSAMIANIILNNEKRSQGIKFYLALYFQIFNLYYIADKKPSDKLKKWIERAGNWCIHYVNSLNLPDANETVQNSIQELFDEINADS